MNRIKKFTRIIDVDLDKVEKDESVFYLKIKIVNMKE